MKKIFTLFAVAAMAVSAYAQDLWTMSVWGLDGIDSETFITSANPEKDGLKYYGTPKTADWAAGNTFEKDAIKIKTGKRLKLGGKSTFQDKKTLNRVFEFQATKGETVYVFAQHGSNTGTRTVCVSQNYSATALDKSTAFGQCPMVDGAIGILEAVVPETGTVYVWSDDNVGIHLIAHGMTLQEIYDALNPTPATIEAPAHDQAEGVVKFDGSKEVVFTPAADSHVVYTSFVAAVTNDAQALAADPTIEHEGKTFTLAADNKVTVDKSGVLHYFAMDPATGVKSPVNTIEFSQTTGINDIDVDNASAPVEYFNLQGIRVENPTNGLYIRRQGNKVTKVVL